jgi:3'(2'), 5'-bisphosphate nucleotidase
MFEEINIEDVKDIARAAGKKILEVYEQDFRVEYKGDTSPLTRADRESNRIIVDGLRKRFSGIPILSEESGDVDYGERSGWGCFWLVDPLDGTKEFIKRNGEFTVNIALVENGKPVLGVVYAPVEDAIYSAKNGCGAFKQVGAGKARRLPLLDAGKASEYVVVASRSHLTKETERYIVLKKKTHPELRMIYAGSSMKLCLVAEGRADVYPRLAPTMEWDTAAAHAIVNEAGRRVLKYGTKQELKYNKKDLHNPWFIVE